ncbi:hypothetical protein AOR_1_612134 [Paecilomyces variotii No. 5]|uniref:ATP-dependent DNA ligase family profile domain-containing protein n=1 Tax=Byssochlamys spectabilis (strain No. 5 / NBRC 109023) TaxID=1356009 RepID=V5FQX5_BYSSN|nr:hypothetical protein AOR_1_612134 [Paecilomyces variotii No. 5]
MGFKFSFLCDLLSDLEANRIVKASTAARGRDLDISTITSFVKLHRRQIHEKGTDLLALLSCFFPEKRTDRVYWLQDASLARIIARCLLLGVSRKGELDGWRASGGSDLGQCVENVMRQAENCIPNGQELTVEEIDAAMDKLASRCRFSGPRLRRQHTAVDVEDTLGPLYRRVSSRDAKWLTRLILKSYYPVVLPVRFILHKIHFLLPHLLLLQDSFEAAANQTFGRWIKLKKDYIPGLGDTVDLLLIGATYKSRDANALKNIQGLLWTHFHVGCLENKTAVSQLHALPKFKVVDVIDRHSLSQKSMHILNSIGRFRACDADSNPPFIVQKGHTGLPDMDAIFKVPFVVELLGSGFDKPSNASYFTLRFPRVLKIHVDRAFDETVSFAELQDLAEKARSVPTDELLQETITWKRRLQHKDKKSEFIIDKSPETTASCCSTPSRASLSAASVSPSLRQISQTSPSASRRSLVTAIPGTSPLCQEIQTTQDIKRRLSTAVQDVCHEGHRRKNPKRSRPSEQDIVIFMDTAQVSPLGCQKIPSPNYPLGSLDNIQPRKESTETGSRDSIMTPSVENENTVPRQAVSHEPTEKTELLKRDRRTAMHETVTTSVPQGPDQTISLQIDLQSPLTTIPMCLGRSFRLRAASGKDLAETEVCQFTSDLGHFIEKLTSMNIHKALSRSNPAAASANMALGIVLVDGARLKKYLDDISTIATVLTNRISSVQAGSPKLPPRGRLFVLDWRILIDWRDIDSMKLCLRDTWKPMAIDHFRSCIAWGRNPTAENGDKLQDEVQGQTEPKDPLPDQTDVTSRDDNGLSTVRTAWDYTMLHEFGEFISLEPLVHVNGDRYVNATAST